MKIGVAGNAYVFLMLFKVTNNAIYLHRAVQFAKFLSKSRFMREANVPDRLFSLYEGIAGTVCFLIDLLHVEQANFPFFQI